MRFPEAWGRVFASREAWLKMDLDPRNKMGGGFGERFGVLIEIPSTGSHEIQYPVFKGSLPDGTIPPRELETTYIEAKVTPTSKIYLIDKGQKRTLNAAQLVPASWTVEIMEFTEELAQRVKASTGIDIKTADGQSWAARQLAMHADPQHKSIVIPIYKLSRQGKYVDQTAEQVVYTIGMAHALSEGITQQAACHAFARDYTRRIVGGELLLDQV